MKNRTLKLGMTLSLLMGLTNIQALEIEDKMIGHITHSIPWVEVRLPYGMTANELAQRYYGNTEEANVILKANRSIRNRQATLRKNMTVHIPVTVNFKDQPERLGWTK